MLKIDQTYKRISAYLKGLLSDRERHDLEKEMMQDAFDEEAFEGLTQLDSVEFNADMEALGKRMDRRLGKGEKRNLLWVYRIAASIILLVGVGTVLYMLLKPPTPSLITQKTDQLKHEAPAETALPSSPVQITEGKRTAQKEVQNQRETNDEVQITEEADEIRSVEKSIKDSVMLPSEYKREIAEINIPAASSVMNEEPAVADKKSDAEEKNYVTGRVTGINQEALAGVTVRENGSSHMTITDNEGNFELRMKNTDSALKLNYRGHKPVELTAKDVSGKEITITEDIIALNKRAKTQRAESTMKTGDTIQAVYVAPYDYIRPVPPGGSLTAFESWVEHLINTDNFGDLAIGKYRIQVSFVVNTDGKVGSIRVKDNVPLSVAGEYKRIVSQSSLWQPALKDKDPVKSEMLIIFSLTVE